MVFELDPCLVRAATGELLARGFVREGDDARLLVEAEHFTGGWLEPGDVASVDVMSSHRGTCTYDAVVAFSEAHRIELVGLRLRTVVQERDAVRVTTAIGVRVAPWSESPEEVASSATFDVVIVDVSATGMRLRCAEELAPGARLALRFVATRTPLDLVLEVVRTEPHGSSFFHGCVLVAVTEREADQLFAFALDEQRRQLAQRRDAR